MMEGAKCQVCGKDEVIGVRCSGLGAMSLAYCSECEQCGAEPEFMFAITAEMCGTEVADFVRDMKTFKDGAYVGWSDWIASGAGKAAVAMGLAQYG
jgi:hypothetical protein